MVEAATGAELPPVAVIVPVYNGAETIEACLESLLALDYPADRRAIVVVNNGSTDGTGVLLERWSGRVRVINEALRGPGAARNAGIRATAQEYLAFTDADCVVDKNWLRRLVAPLLEDPTVAAAGGRILAVNAENPVARFGERIHDHRKALTEYEPRYFITMNIAMRRAALDRVGLFDETFQRAEDCDLSYRMGLGSFRFAYADGAVVYHHNEEKLSGLLREGFLHGMWQVKLAATYRARLPREGRRFHRWDYVMLGRALEGTLRSLVRGRVAWEPLCDLVFRAGKKAGNLWGSARFGYWYV